MAEPRIDKAYPCVCRHTDTTMPELLVFDHPAEMVQLPKGSFESGETPEQACRRELLEETGLKALRRLADLGTLELIAPRRCANHQHEEPQRWHVMIYAAETDCPDSWSHHPSGGGSEDGLVFGFRWVPLAAAKQELHRLYHPAVDLVTKWWTAKTEAE